MPYALAVQCKCTLKDESARKQLIADLKDFLGKKTDIIRSVNFLVVKIQSHPALPFK